MAAHSAIPDVPPGASVQRMHRITRENRSLWYQLTVLQQPLRARACGSGMKANSDRRPVDPPPVIELRIIEGPTVEEGKDITFDYNANFFLYASLEKARDIAPGRLPNAVANNPPILTGVPASGMAYLDRPTEAGYFIFPDLSVRHEGRFVLNFSLFETTKEEKDFDREPVDSALPPGVDWRMEIKTEPFHVYSAKKFPGLMESTQLSKTVADQGCRVRIRRDVRMRKRDTPKSGGGSGGYDRREEEYSRRKAGTPVPTRDDPRARSHSNSSEHRVPHAPHVSQPPPPPQRRPSVVDSYPAPPPPPSYDSNQTSSRGHLGFGDSMSHYSTPRPYGHHQAAPTHPIAHSGSYPPPSHSPYVKSEPQSFYHSRSASSTCPSPASSVKPDCCEPRHSGSYVPPSPVSYSDSQSRRDSHASYPSTPLAAPPPKQSHNEVSRGYLKIASLVSPLPPMEAQTEPLPPPPMILTGGKRKHEIVFSQNLRPLYNGQRQQDPHYGVGHRGYTPDPDQGMYSRADGKIGVVTFNTFNGHQYHS